MCVRAAAGAPSAYLDGAFMKHMQIRGWGGWAQPGNRLALAGRRLSVYAGPHKTLKQFVFRGQGPRKWARAGDFDPYHGP